MTEYQEKMVEVGELKSSPEAPKSSQVFKLPEISVNGRRVRLGMHMDTAVNFLSFLSTCPELLDLKLKGRVITPSQYERLRYHPTHRFYMSGRVVRARDERGADIITLISPRDLQWSAQDVLNAAKNIYSPDSLSPEIGFQVAWYEASDLTGLRFANGGMYNGILPILGGCNEFEIGSDRLSPAQLEQFSWRLGQYLYDMDIDLQALRNRGTTTVFSTATLRNSQNLTPLGSPLSTDYSIKLSNNKIPIDNYIINRPSKYPNNKNIITKYS